MQKQAVQNLYLLLEKTVKHYAEQPAYYVQNNHTDVELSQQSDESDSDWQVVTWQTYKQEVDYFALALLREGFCVGDTVAILAGNHLVWPVADMGCIAAGGIGVGLYPTSSAEQCAYILNHCESTYLVLDSTAQLNKILSIKKQVPGLKTIIVTADIELSDTTPGDLSDGTPEIIYWNDFIHKGREQIQHPQQWEDYQNLAYSRQYEDIAIIVYTSGTTGNPKGACLSHRYVLASVQALEQFVQTVLQALPSEKQAELKGQVYTTLSYLPYCHVAERISGMYTRLYRGDSAYLVSDYSRLNEVMAIAQPHGFGGLPRIFEKLYAAIMQRVEQNDGIDKQQFLHAIEINQRYRQLQQQGETVSESLQQAFVQADKDVYQKVRAYFGPRILYCSSGAAPLPEKVLELFRDAGNLPILEAYGLTEFVCCAFNTPQENRAGSVGKPMLGCEIKIANDGEILLKGPQIFSGYYKDQQATDEVIDAQGWLHSGDIGRLDDDGFLYITGRKKEFIKTSTGKKIAPLAIENLCKRNHLISNVMVIGDNRKYLSALLTLNEVELFAYAAQHQLKYEQYADLTQHPRIQSLVADVIDTVNHRVSRTERIKKYEILTQDFSIQRNEITPTGKIKRKIISEHYAEHIENLYDSDWERF